MLAAAALFGTTGTVLVNSPDAADAASVGALRLLIGGLTLFAIAWWQRPSTPWHSLSPASIGLASVGVAVFQLGYFFAVERTGVAVGTVITIGAGPMMAGAMAAILGRHRPARSWLAGTAISVGGVALLGLVGRSVEVDLLGMTLAVIAGCGWALFSTVGKYQISLGADSTMSMATMFCGGGVLVAPLLLWHSPSWVLQADGALVVLYLGIVTVGIAYTLYGRALRHLHAPAVVTLTLFEPVTAAVLGTVVVHEEVCALGWVGVMLVLVGLVVTSGGALRRDRPES